MSKDPFQILADELTLIRKDMDHLQRTSLDRDEASELHGYFMRDIESLRETYAESPEVFKDALKADRDQMARMASQAATEAAERVMGDMRDQLIQERLKLSQAAGEARREAWRWFGGFWVWLASVGTAGALLGVLAAFWMTGRGDARQFGSFPGIYCGNVVGQVIEQSDGSTYCAIWIKPPPEPQN